MAQFWAMGIISAASPHPKDVPVARDFWWGIHGLGAISLRKKKQISAVAAVDCGSAPQNSAPLFLLSRRRAAVVSA